MIIQLQFVETDRLLRLALITLFGLDNLIIRQSGIRSNFWRVTSETDGDEINFKYLKLQK